MLIVVGLGNPGAKYEFTRHNAGFMALDHLVRARGLEWEYNKKFDADIIKNGDTIYVKPRTFMNNSGTALCALLSYYKLLPKKFGFLKEKNLDLANMLVVIHDDIDIELGKFKLSQNSRAAGHKGVQSIIDCLKTKNFKRLRIGIKSNKPEQMQTMDFVLQKFPAEEQKIIEQTIKELNLEAQKNILLAENQG